MTSSRETESKLRDLVETLELRQVSDTAPVGGKPSSFSQVITPSTVSSSAQKIQARFS